MRREFGELILMKAQEINEQGELVPNGLVKNFIFDKGSERYVFTDPGKGLDYLVDRRQKILDRRSDAVEVS